MITEQKFITLKDGTELHTKILEANGPVWLIATHGIGEHLERHNYLKDLFGPYFNLCLYDLRGHGRSMGEKFYIDDFNTYLRDLGEMIFFLREEYKMQRYILFGHSMGALIVAAYLQQMAVKDFYPEKVFLSAPPAGFHGAQGMLLKMLSPKATGFLSSIPFSLKLAGLVDIENLSHNPNIKAEYENDLLAARSLHSRLVLQLANCAKQVFSSPIDPQCPTFCAVGTGDRIVSAEVLKHYFSKIETNVELRLFEDAYHEMHNEIEKYQVPYFAYLKQVLLEGIYQAQGEGKESAPAKGSRKSKKTE